MAYYSYGIEKLRPFCEAVFKGFGFSGEESGIITDVLLLSDLYGIESHGMQRMVRYHKGIEKGLIKVGAKWDTVFETPISAVLDANDGMGQLVGRHAMALAIEKAKKSGVGLVSVRNSNHYGISGYYAKMACDEGLIGLSMTNIEAIMVPTNSRLAMLGSNPIAMAMPAEPYDFFFDGSTTVVTRGKLEIYQKKGEPLPDGWAMGADGRTSTDATAVLENIVAKNGGGILPLGGAGTLLGGHKGYGYGMICEICCSILSLGVTSNHTHTGGKGGTCHSFIAVDPALFGDREAIKRHFSAFLQELREAPLAEGARRIYTHGEKEIEAMAERMKNGVPINENTIFEMKDICDYLGIDFESYLGKFDFSGRAVESSYR